DLDPLRLVGRDARERRIVGEETVARGAPLLRDVDRGLLRDAAVVVVRRRDRVIVVAGPGGRRDRPRPGRGEDREHRGRPVRREAYGARCGISHASSSHLAPGNVLEISPRVDPTVVNLISTSSSFSCPRLVNCATATPSLPALTVAGTTVRVRQSPPGQPPE